MEIDVLDIFMSRMEDYGIITGWTEFMQKEQAQADNQEKDDAEQNE